MPKPTEFPKDRRLFARACRAAERQEGLSGYIAKIYRAIFVENREADEVMLLALAAEPQQLSRDMASEELEARVTADAAHAFRYGTFGVLLESGLRRRLRG